jgi:hypothetical protein
VSSVPRSELEGKPRAGQWPPRGPVRLLNVLDRQTMVDLIRMTLNHGVYMAQFGQEIVRNWGIKRRVVALDVPLDSGVAEGADSRPVDPVIFRAVEVHELEYPPGPKFR